MSVRFWTMLALVSAAMPLMAATPQAAVEARQGNFKQIGRATKAIADEFKKPSPDVAVIRASAPTLETLSGKLLTWFPRGTGKESGMKTEAGPAIWQKPAEFRAAAGKLRNAARGLNVAAASGDLDRIKPAFGALGAACKGCHESFRVKD